MYSSEVNTVSEVTNLPNFSTSTLTLTNPAVAQPLLSTIPLTCRTATVRLTWDAPLLATLFITGFATQGGLAAAGGGGGLEPGSCSSSRSAGRAGKEAHWTSEATDWADTAKFSP